MNVLLSLLHSSPEYESLRAMLDAGQTAAVSGVSQIARAHWIAALHEDTGRPVVAVCQDEMAASRLAAELTAFLGRLPRMGAAAAAHPLRPLGGQDSRPRHDARSAPAPHNSEIDALRRLHPPDGGRQL